MGRSSLESGRPRTTTDPAGKDTTYTYDALGRVLAVTLPKPTPSFSGNFTTTYAYDNLDSGSGLVFTHITDPNGRLTKLGYDEHGRLLKSIDAASNTTTYAYTRGRLESLGEFTLPNPNWAANNSGKNDFPSSGASEPEDS